VGVKKPIPRAYVIVGLAIIAWLVVIGLIMLGVQILHPAIPWWVPAGH
jgi:hypothetical protein